MSLVGGGGRGQVVEAKLRAVLTDPWTRQGGPKIFQQKSVLEFYSLNTLIQDQKLGSPSNTMLRKNSIPEKNTLSFGHCHNCGGGADENWENLFVQIIQIIQPYSIYLYLGFHLFHDKAKRTQQGNLLPFMQCVFLHTMDSSNAIYKMWACKRPPSTIPLQPWGLTPSVDKISVFFLADRVGRFHLSISKLTKRHQQKNSMRLLLVKVSSQFPLCYRASVGD